MYRLRVFKNPYGQVYAQLQVRIFIWFYVDVWAHVAEPLKEAERTLASMKRLTETEKRGYKY